MQTVGDKCEVHVMLKGLVDVDREISRLQEKITKLSIQLDKLQTAMATEGYEQKVQSVIIADSVPYSLNISREKIFADFKVF